jgi:circadian clock protein KaiB
MKARQTKNNNAAGEFEKILDGRPGIHYVLRLFITGMTPRSQEAISNVKKLCEEHLKGRFELEVIDIYQQPLSASENQILAAPTLIKMLPLPIRRFVGNMTKTEKILAGLDLVIEEKIRY